MWRSQPLHIHTQATLYWNLHITEANEPSTWDDRWRAHQLIYLLTCNCSGTMAVPLTGTASLTLPTKSQLTAWNNTSDETFITRLSQREGMSEQPYPSCSRTHTKNQTAITPGRQSLDAEPQQP